MLSTKPDISAKVGSGGIETSVGYGPLQLTIQKGDVGRKVGGLLLLILGIMGIIASMKISSSSGAFAVLMLSLIFLALGPILMAAGGGSSRPSLPTPPSRLFRRHDIICPTNWARGKERKIDASTTERFTIKVPDTTFLHAFHVGIRHTLEDLGYVILTDVSPAEGTHKTGYSSSRLLLRAGIYGYKYRNRDIEFWILEEGELIDGKVTGILMLTAGLNVLRNSFLDEGERDFNKVIEYINSSLNQHIFDSKEI